MQLHRKLAGAAAALLAILSATAVALAATPKKGARFNGTLLTETSSTGSGPVQYGKYRSPVSFEVSSSGSRVSGFRYGYLGCIGGSGGPVTHNPYTTPYAVKKLAAAPVAAGGTFTASGSKSSYTSPGAYATTTTTISSLSGRFTSATKASGTIKLTQTQTYNGHTSHCGPVTLTWSARAA